MSIPSTTTKPAASPISPKPSIYKKEFDDLPLRVPKSWCRDFQEKADELGVSRNSLICLALKFGTPMVQAHIELMRKTLRDNCRKIADGKSTVEKVFLKVSRKS